MQRHTVGTVWSSVRIGYIWNVISLEITVSQQNNGFRASSTEFTDLKHEREKT